MACFKERRDRGSESGKENKGKGRERPNKKWRDIIHRGT